MRLPALDPVTFWTAKISNKQTAFRFDYEVQPFAFIGINQDGPVWVVAA